MALDYFIITIIPLTILDNNKNKFVELQTDRKGLGIFGISTKDRFTDNKTVT